MSRIGKKPIIIPDQVQVSIKDDEILVKGPKGELKQELPEELIVKEQEQSIEGVSGKEITLKPKKDSKKVYALWGLYRSLIANMVEGVVHGVKKVLEIEGVGYRAEVQGDKLILNIGFSHPVEIIASEGIQLQAEKNVITISGIDKQLVGQIAAEIRAIRKPEPYKGKGIRYQGEKVRRKAGKKAASGE